NPETTAAVLYEGEALVDLDQILQGLFEYASLIGCVFRAGLGANSISSEPSCVRVSTNQGSICADFVVVAAGLGYDRVSGLPHIPVVPIRGEVIEALGPPGFCKRSLYAGNGFIAPRRDGRVLLGSNYDAHTEDMDSDISTIRIGAALDALDANLRIAPAIS